MSHEEPGAVVMSACPQQLVAARVAAGLTQPGLLPLPLFGFSTALATGFGTAAAAFLGDAVRGLEAKPV